MPTKKWRAVEVITEKLWITYDHSGAKSGTLTRNESEWVWLADNQKNQMSDSEVLLTFELEGKSEISSWHQQHVFGYPVIKTETFKIQERNNLPCFTKTPKSNTFFCAGYYGINFDNGGWMESFCPKLVTLRKYEHIGPFKSETDMQIAVQRKKRQYE